MQKTCDNEKAIAKQIIDQINDFTNAQDIKDAAKKSLAKQDKPYTMPRRFDPSKDTDRVYNSVSSYDDETGMVAFMAGDIVPKMGPKLKYP